MQMEHCRCYNLKQAIQLILLPDGNIADIGDSYEETVHTEDVPNAGQLETECEEIVEKDGSDCEERNQWKQM